MRSWFNKTYTCSYISTLVISDFVRFVVAYLHTMYTYKCLTKYSHLSVFAPVTSNLDMTVLYRGSFFTVVYM